MSNPIEPNPATSATVTPTQNPPKPVSAWKRLRYRLEVTGAKLLIRVLTWVPRRTVHTLGIILGWIAYHLLRSNRKIALANLDLAFGDTKTPREKARIARVSCQSFAATLLTFFWSTRLNRQALEEIAEVDRESLQKIQELRAQGRPIIFITLHYGDWELLGQATGLYDVPTTIVMRTMRNPGLEEIFSRLRAITGHRIIPHRFAAAKLLKTLKNGGSTALLIDQHVPERLGGIWCRFFGVPVLTTPAIAQLAMHSGAVILGGVTSPLPGGRVRIAYGPEISYTPTRDKDADIQAITQQCLDFCESVIRRQPEYWLWSYKRWKTRPTPEEGRFPFYARFHAPPPAGIRS